MQADTDKAKWTDCNHVNCPMYHFTGSNHSGQTGAGANAMDKLTGNGFT